MEEPVTATESRFKPVYSVVDRGADRKPFWLRLGAAFTNRDGSMTVLLDAYPKDGRLQIRDRDGRPAPPRRGGELRPTERRVPPRGERMSRRGLVQTLVLLAGVLVGEASFGAPAHPGAQASGAQVARGATRAANESEARRETRARH